MSSRTDADTGKVQPELAVVVMGLRAPANLASAVKSLRSQSIDVEIVIVNSGGGDISFLQPEAGTQIVLADDVLLPGAARNVGITHSRAPFIAFLASDHVAKPDWAAQRLAAHKAGHRSVASAVLNSNPMNLISWAHHLSILVRRLPGVPPDQALRYGVSYDRALFDTYGLFNKDMRIGEDTDFNARLPDEDQPFWAPNVQTIHKNPTGLRAMLKEQYQRGRRSGYHWNWKLKTRIAGRIYYRFMQILPLALVSVRGFERIVVAASTPFLIMAVTSYELGVRAGLRDRRNAVESNN